MKKLVLWAMIALVLGMGAYIRLAPSAPAQWHIAPVAEGDQDLPGGVLRVVATGPEGLQKSRPRSPEPRRAPRFWQVRSMRA